MATKVKKTSKDDLFYMEDNFLNDLDSVGQWFDVFKKLNNNIKAKNKKQNKNKKPKKNNKDFF